MVRKAKQTEITPKLEWNLLVATAEKRLVQRGSLLNWYTSQARTKVPDITNDFPTRLINMNVPTPTKATVSFKKPQQIATVLPSCSGIVHDRFFEPSPYAANWPLYESVSLFTITHTSTSFNVLKTLNNYSKMTEKG